MPPLKVTVSKETHHYLELYTNNYGFHLKVLSLKTNDETCFTVSTSKNRMRVNQDKLTSKVLNTESISKIGNSNTLGGSKGGREDSKVFSGQAQSNS